MNSINKLSSSNNIFKFSSKNTLNNNNINNNNAFLSTDGF